MAKGGRREHSGRKPKPTDLKVLQGTFRGDRHGDEAQPVAKAFPPAPGHLTERENALWQNLKQHCEPWAAESDWIAFNGVVSLTDRVLRVQEAMQETETSASPVSLKFTPSADGEPNAEVKENPLYGLEIKCWRELRAFIGLTGLSPVDRARVKANTDCGEAKNPLDRFIKKARG